jgi:exonuclease III
MSLISWNCRGLGSPNAIPDLKYLVRHFNPDLLFLTEMLVHRNKIEELRYLLGFDFCFSVDRIGRGGGLALFWRASFNCQIVNYSQNHISVDVMDSVLGLWRLTGYYGYHERGRRRLAWDFLRNLSNQFTGPWCILGDFNDIMDASEKRGRNIRSNWLINGFRQAVLESGLVDVLVEGYPYTWFKSLGTSRAAEERLDRALANNGWFNLFPSAMLENLASPSSDHYPILLNINPVQRHHLHKRGFRYENAWYSEPGFKELVNDAWHTVVIRLCLDYQSVQQIWWPRIEIIVIS